MFTTLLQLPILVLPLFLLGTFISSNAELVYKGNDLEGLNLTDFPNGEFENVQIIDFHDNDLNTLNPSVFEEHKFFNVNTASIRHSNIRYIHPYAFAKMSNLLDLSLYGNNLTIFQKDTFAGLESLQHLDLGHNQIVLFDALILKPLQSLITLDLSYNRLNGITSQFIKHSSLSELELSGNSLQFAAEGPIFSSHSLTRLVMTFCNIIELPSDAFVELRQIRNLDLSNNKLEVFPKDLLKPLVYLEHFDVGYNSLRHLDAEMFSSPTNFNTLLCDENHSELTFSCEDFMKDLESKRNHHAIEETGQNTTNVETKGNRTGEVFQLQEPDQNSSNVEKQGNRTDEVFQLEEPDQNTTIGETQGNRRDEVFQLQEPDQNSSNVEQQGNITGEVEEPDQNTTIWETQENRTDEVFQLVIVICIVICACLFVVDVVGVMMYVYWQKRGYSSVLTRE